MVNSGRNGGETTYDRHGCVKLGFGSKRMDEVSGERKLRKINEKRTNE